MINILSYMGMPLQSELCLWTMLGLVTTIFDATLFKVNSNLIQVWAMEMPSELSMPVQRVLRTMISGIMLVQCFTVYIYLASYIVMLYPIYLEERPSLLLPWLLLAAVKKLLCELMSLALGLGTCVLVGPTRSACIKFVITKISSLLPSFYMWLLVFSYYNILKLTSGFLKFPAVRPSGSDHDYGLELAVRRRRTKSLLDEQQLRSRLLQNIRSSQSLSNDNSSLNLRTKNLYRARGPILSDTSVSEVKNDSDIARPFSIASSTLLMEDWFGSEIAMPRDSDRVVNQFSLMLLRIAAFINSGETDTRKFLQLQNTKTSYDDDITSRKYSYRSSYRKSEAPTIKSDDAVVYVKCDIRSCNLFSLSENENQDIGENITLLSSTEYSDSDAVVSSNDTENTLPWNRTRKAKSFKINQMIRRRGSKHSKLKVSQSILDLINRCRKDVHETLNNVENYKVFEDTARKISNRSNNQSTHLNTRYQTCDQSTSTSIPKNEITENLNRNSKSDKGVSTHDKIVSKSYKTYDNISSIQQLSASNIDREKYIDDQSAWSEEFMLQENTEEHSSSPSDILNNTANNNSNISMKTEDSILTSKAQESEEIIKNELSRSNSRSNDICSGNVKLQGSGRIELQGNSNIKNNFTSTVEAESTNSTHNNSDHLKEGNKSENTSSETDAEISQTNSDEKH